MMDSEIFKLCMDCAHSIYGYVAPSSAYASRTGNLLYGTCVQESGNFRWQRQIGFGIDDIRGGWSWWQLQRNAVDECIRLLSNNVHLFNRTTEWIFGIPAYKGSRWFNYTQPIDLMRQILWQPRMAVAFARLYYMTDAAPIPETLLKQAAYWKDVYNTSAGKGRAEEYIDKWNKHAVPIVEDYWMYAPEEDE